MNNGYTFEMLLRGDPRAIAGAEQRFQTATDPARKLRIASILISRGVRDQVYFDYLSTEARKALESPIPWPTNDNVPLTDSEVRLIKALWRLAKPATIEQIAAALKGDSSTCQDLLRALIEDLKQKGYIRLTKSEVGDIYQPLVAIRENDANYVQAYTLNSAFVTWCKQHRDKDCSQWYQEAVYPEPDPWYFLAAAGDHRSYDLLLQGLHSQNEGIAIWAAQGLARLQDPRAVDDIALVAKHEGYEANVAIAKCLLYFHDARAQSLAAEILDDKKIGDTRIIDITRHEVDTKGVRGLFPW